MCMGFLTSFLFAFQIAPASSSKKSQKDRSQRVDPKDLKDKAALGVLRALFGSKYDDTIVCIFCSYTHTHSHPRKSLMLFFTIALFGCKCRIHALRVDLYSCFLPV